MNSMAATLVARSQWPFVPDQVTKARASACSTRTDTRISRIRQLLAERGAMTALQIAVTLDLDSLGRVSALLKNDLTTGRVECDRTSSPYRYSLSETFDRELRRELRSATALLRRHGFTVEKASP